MRSSNALARREEAAASAVAFDALPPPIAAGPRRSQRLRTVMMQRTVLSLSLGLLLVHITTSLFLPAHGWVTFAGRGLSYFIASVVAYSEARRSVSMMRVRWMMVATGMGLGALSFLLMIYRQSMHSSVNGVAGVSDVVLLLRGVPFLIAVSLSKRENSRVFVRLDLIQGLLAVFVACMALLFAFPAPGGGFIPVSSLLAVDRIAAANMLVAIAATVRVFGVNDREERRFFWLLCIFLWANVGATGLIHMIAFHQTAALPGSMIFMLGDLPILGFALACGAVRAGRVRFTGVGPEGTFADTASSFLFPLWIFLLAASTVPNHFYFGMGSVTLIFVLYGIRSTVVQARYLAAQEELRQANDRSRDQALLDGLTEIPNRRSFDLTLDREWKRAQRSRQTLALLLLDIDHFKVLNDTFGHPVGDFCLRELASLLRGALGREVDFAARYGGEEFAILLMDTGAEGAKTVAEGLRRTVEMHRCKDPSGPNPTMTVSIGIAARVPTLHEPSSSLVTAADKALYRAKHNGRNRVET